MITSSGYGILTDSQGLPIWANRYSAPELRLYDVDPTVDGAFIVAGEHGSDAWMMKLGFNGSIGWQTAYDFDGDASFFGTTPVESGAFIAVGTRQGAPDVFVAARVSSEGRVAQDCATTETDILTTPESPVHLVGFTHNVAEGIGAGTTTSASDTLVAETEHCQNLSSIVFDDFGTGTPGSGGYTPFLSGVDGYCDGDETRIELQDGLGRGEGFLAIGINDIDVPFLNGRLFVDLGAPHVFVSIRLSGFPGQAGEGSLSLPLRTDLSRHTGLTLFGQAFLFDPQGFGSLTMTNRLDLHVF